jgi:energy-coupling factor transport system ATP-binding protein
VAVARVEGLTFRYPGEEPALRDVSLELHEGEFVALLGPSGAGKSTLLRALSGLVPHFHGGRFEGRVTVGGLDTRTARPARLAATVGTVFQDPEEQVVMTGVDAEVAFGLEQAGTPPQEIWPRVDEALDAVGARHLAGRQTAELSGGELQRVCLAAVLARRPRLLLLDEPTSQLDPEAAERFLACVARLGAAVVLSEQRVERALELAQRVLFVEEGRLLLDGPRAEARAWLDRHRPAYVASPSRDAPVRGSDPGTEVCRLARVSFAYPGGPPVLDAADLVVRRGEVVVLEGPNGSGKTTLAKLAAGLLEPGTGTARREGRATYLSQDPGRYLLTERVLDEVALAVGGNAARARAALDRVDLGWAADRHPRDLSSGERERLGLAAVAVTEPDLLVLDEPTRGVDPERKRALGEWLARYAESGHGVLVATHDRSFPAHRRVALGSREVLLVA